MSHLRLLGRDWDEYARRAQERMEIADTGPWPEEELRMRQCDHGVTYDPDAAKNLSAAEVRRRWPRLHGTCPKGCGFSGIAYASGEHYVMGDW